MHQIFYFNDPDDDVPSVYHWAEGNAGCDCNRGPLFLGKVDWSFECSERKLFTIEIYDPVDGLILYSEFNRQKDEDPYYMQDNMLKGIDLLYYQPETRNGIATEGI